MADPQTKKADGRSRGSVWRCHGDTWAMRRARGSGAQQADGGGTDTKETVLQAQNDLPTAVSPAPLSRTASPSFIASTC